MYGDNECLTVVLLAPFHVLTGKVNSVVWVAGDKDVIRRAQPLLILVVQDRRQCRAHCRSGAPPRAPDLLALLGADQDDVAAGAGRPPAAWAPRRDGNWTIGNPDGDAASR